MIRRVYGLWLMGKRARETEREESGEMFIDKKTILNDEEIG